MAVTRNLSFEDAKINVGSTVATSRNVPYSDLDLTFANKTTGDVYKKVDAAAVKQAVKTILQTNFGEKPFQPYFGANIRELLFENVTETTMSITLARNIRFAIEKYEPRAVVEDVEILDLSDKNSVYARITFRVINTQELVVLDTAISRIR